MKFDQYYISTDIKNNLRKLGFKRPTDIQYKSIPSILKGEDVLAIAQTGTGKTAAFAIPVIDKIHRAKNSKRCIGISCLVMAPTRELTQQIAQVFDMLSAHTKVKTFGLYGGVEQERQIAKLQDGIDILVTTPGRMFDLINQDEIRLNMVNTLVLDEADHMLDLGFIEDIKYVKKILKRRHQTLFFSATINDEIKKLAYSQVKSEAIRIQVSPDDKVSKNVSHAVMFVEMDDKRFFLERLIHDNADKKIIVFVRTKVRAERVVKAMARADIEAIDIHGGKDQHERTRAMQLFREGQCRIMVATDVSARGIDIADIKIVINYDLPEKCENYVHRVGRTGRGVNKGTAISFCSQEEKDMLVKIQSFLKKPIETIHVAKDDYANTIALSPEGSSLKDLVAEDIAWEKSQKKKKRKKRKKR